MFSKKPQPALQTAAPAPAAPLSARIKTLVAPLANPYIGASAAALLLLLSIAALVAVGDPRAGAPIARVALIEDAGAAHSDGTVTVTGLAAPDGGDPLLAALAGSENSEMVGEAVVTLPGCDRETIDLGRPQGLPQAPIAGFTQSGPGGVLPAIASDGRTPAQVYARPFAANGKPRVAIVIGGLGIDPATTRRAIETLPPEVTLSFAVYAEGLQGWIDMARSYGHEVLLEAPMEPKSFPADDPGPHTLMANARPEDTLRKLDAILSRGSGYFGVANYMGSKFVTSTGGMETFAAGLKRRGLAFVDDGSAIQKGGGIPRASADRIIDDQPGPEAIGKRLSEIEQAAGKRGFALGSGFGYPVTVQQVAQWAQGLPQRGYQLAPASALTVKRG